MYKNPLEGIFAGYPDPLEGIFAGYPDICLLGIKHKGGGGVDICCHTADSCNMRDQHLNAIKGCVIGIAHITCMCKNHSL